MQDKPIPSDKYFGQLTSLGQSNIFADAVTGITSGIHICRTAVERTIGGRGTNAVIKQEFYPFYIQTKDAFSIIKHIDCQHPLERLAVDMMKDATDSMNKRSKDGRTTMCILADEVLAYAQESKIHGLDIEAELTALLPKIEASIDAQTRKIVKDDGTIDLKSLEAVATTAADSARLGKLIAGIYAKQGKDCIINHIEASGTWDDEVTFTDGVRFMDTGFLSPYMVHDEEAKKDNRPEKRAVYFNPVIMVTRRKIMTEQDIIPLVKSLLDQGKKDLIIFTDDMDSNVAATLISTHRAGVMNICIIKAPVLWKESVFEDFAKVTGSTIVEDASGVTFKNLSFSHLGTCGKIVIDKEETVITGIADISEHIADLKKSDHPDAQLRLWWLTNKTATIRLGATNEGELSLMRLKCEDAIHSAQLALQEGIVPGGGVALINAGATTTILPGLKKVLEAPARQIRRNAGLPDVNYLYSGTDTGGLDAKTGKDVDMFKANIVDAAVVVKNAVRNAFAIASRVLTSNIFLDEPYKDQSVMIAEAIGKSRNPFQ